MQKTPRWMTAALRASALALPVLPWQRGYRTADQSAAVAETQSPADTQRMRKIA